MQLPAPDDDAQATTSTPTTTGKSLQPLATDDTKALRRLSRYRYPLDRYTVESPFPLSEQQQESLREGAIRPARVPEAEAVRTASQALIGGSTRTRGWGAKAALGPVAEGLAQYLEWHAGARDRPDLGRAVYESAVPLAFTRETIEQKTPRPEGESTEAEQHEAYKRAQRAWQDLVTKEKERQGIPTDPTWEEVLGEENPLDVLLPPERHPPLGYAKPAPDAPLPPYKLPSDPTRNKQFPHEEPIEAEWEPLPDEEHDYEDWPKEQDEIDAEPDTGPIAHDPIGEDYVSLPHVESDAEWRRTKRMAAFRKGGPVQTGARIGALAAMRGAGPAGTQPGMNPQFLRRVDAELEARMKGDYAFSIFQPFTTRELEQMRDVEIK